MKEEQIPIGTRESILAADDIKLKLVLLPEWKCKLFVRTLSGLERDQWEAKLASMRKEYEEKTKQKFRRENVRAHFCAMTACNEKGERLFSFDDIEALGHKSGAALDRLFDAAAELNRLRNEDVEELLKNFESAPN